MNAPFAVAVDAEHPRARKALASAMRAGGDADAAIARLTLFAEDANGTEGV